MSDREAAPANKRKFLGEIRESDERDIPTDPKGLKDAGHFIIECSNCLKPLVDLWLTRPGERIRYKDGKEIKTLNVVWKVQATCCYCGDHSFVQEIQGGFHSGPIFESRGENDDVKLHDVDDPIVDGNRVLFNTRLLK